LAPLRVEVGHKRLPVAPAENAGGLRQEVVQATEDDEFGLHLFGGEVEEPNMPPRASAAQRFTWSR
jgi:hypothetical protein